jgi:hypothetical protein
MTTPPPPHLFRLTTSHSVRRLMSKMSVRRLMSKMNKSGGCLCSASSTASSVALTTPYGRRPVNPMSLELRQQPSQNSCGVVVLANTTTTATTTTHMAAASSTTSNGQQQQHHHRHHHHGSSVASTTSLVCSTSIPSVVPVKVSRQNTATAEDGQQQQQDWLVWEQLSTASASVSASCDIHPPHGGGLVRTKSCESSTCTQSLSGITTSTTSVCGGRVCPSGGHALWGGNTVSFAAVAAAAYTTNT